METDKSGILFIILLFTGFIIYLIRSIILRHRKKKTNTGIIYQDNKVHLLKYNKIPTYKDIPFHDFQYVYYLLSLIHKQPFDQFVIIYCQLIKWQNENDLKIEKDDNIINIRFYQNKTANRIENVLYQMLYEISEENMLDFYTLKIWFQTDFQKVEQWIKDYLQDKDYQLRNNGTILNGKYSLEIYHDLQKLLGYKKFLENYNYQIKNEEEYLYALLFELDVDKLDLYPQLMMPAYNPHFTSR